MPAGTAQLRSHALPPPSSAPAAMRHPRPTREAAAQHHARSRHRPRGCAALRCPSGRPARSPVSLTQAEPAAAGHGGAEPIHVGVPLAVGLPHHLRLHDLRLAGHGGAERRRAKNRHRSHRAAAQQRSRRGSQRALRGPVRGAAL